MADMGGNRRHRRDDYERLSDERLLEVWAGTADEKDETRRLRAVMERTGVNGTRLRTRLRALGQLKGEGKKIAQDKPGSYAVTPVSGEDKYSGMVADDYAKGVLSGEIVACENVRIAARRHMRDHERDRSECYFDYDLERRLLKFGREEYILEDGSLMRFYPWQIFVVSSLLCWKKREWNEEKQVHEWVRKYDKAYIETSKGSGKTPLVSFIALVVFLANADKAAQIYYAATDLDQARNAFNDFAWAIRRNRKLHSRISTLGGANPNEARFYGKQSFAKIVAQKVQGRGLSGRRPNLWVCDELHEWHESRGDSMIREMEASLSKRASALLLIITNSGESQHGPCWDYHNRAISVLKAQGGEDAAERERGDGLFAFVCSMDDGDAYDDPAVWPKTNPSLPGRPTEKWLKGELEESRGNIKRLRSFRRKYLCEWLSDTSPYVDMDIVDKCMPRVLDPADKDGERVLDNLSPWKDRQNGMLFLGIDLGETSDFTVYSKMWLMPDGSIEAAVEPWTPGETLEARSLTDNAPYMRMKSLGFLHTTPGAYVRWSDVGRQLKALVEGQGYRRTFGIAYDPRFFPEFNTDCHKIGLKFDRVRSARSVLMVPHPPYAHRVKSRDPDLPSLYVNRSLTVLEQWLHDGRIKIRFNPMLPESIRGGEDREQGRCADVRQEGQADLSDRHGGCFGVCGWLVGRTGRRWWRRRCRPGVDR